MENFNRIEDNASSTTAYLADTALLVQYLSEVGDVTPLTREEEFRLGKAIRNGDEEAREKLIRNNLPLVINIATIYGRKNSRVSLPDLIQEGNLGLMKAAEKFDPQKGCRFSTYATWWVRAKIEYALMMHSYVVHVPTRWGKLLNKYNRKCGQMASKGFGESTFTQIVHSMELASNEIDNLRHAIAASRVTIDDSSILASMTSTDAFNSAIESSVKHSEEREDMRSALDILSSRERQYVSLCFGLYGGRTRTHGEIGQMEGYSREAVRLVIKDALGKLRIRLGNDAKERKDTRGGKAKANRF